MKYFLVLFLFSSLIQAAPSSNWFPDADVGTKESKNLLRVELLKKSIELTEEKLKSVSGLKKYSSNAKANSFYNQGLFELFTFNWVDAIRSFKMAIDLDPEFFNAYLAMTDAYVEAGLEKYAAAVLLKAESLKRQASSGAIEWLNYMKAYVCYYNSENCSFLSLETLSDERFSALQKKYSDTITKLFIYEKEYDLVVLTQNKFLKDEKILTKILSINSNYIGAHHLLVHYFENTGDYPKALLHSKKMAELAPMSAHAQHMYGHILPKMGKWTEAIAQFEKADKIHEEWFAKNSALPSEEWHYPHNLDLMAHAYNWMGKYDLAEKNWKKNCDTFQSRYCGTYALFLIAQKKFQKAKEVLAPLPGSSDVESLMTVIDFMENTNNSEVKAKIFALGKTARPSDVIAKVYLIISSQIRTDLQKPIAEAIADSISDSGFDTWSKNVLLADVYAVVADQLNMKALAADIRVSKQNVGFVCRASVGHNKK